MLNDRIEKQLKNDKVKRLESTWANMINSQSKL